MRKTLYAAAVAAALIVGGCGEKAPAEYVVTSTLGAEAEGLTAYLVDYDTGEKLDSVVAGPGGELTFRGTTSGERLVRLIVDGQRRGVLVLGSGNITVDPETHLASGTPLNDLFRAYDKRSDELLEKYESIATDSAGLVARQAVMDEYNAYSDSMFRANAENPLGYYIFLQQAYEMNLDELDAAINATPSLARYQRVNSLRENLKKAAETAEGMAYKDFAVEYNDSTYRLSNYIGRDGHYTLVDFWASWCGPCIKETKTIKRIREKWGDKGLDIVGVAVWDEPENTLKAIEAHSLPWPQILNAQSVPTDLYGISGIPHIILIDPQGRIVSRGLQGAELELAVDKALSATTPTAEE